MRRRQFEDTKKQKEYEAQEQPVAEIYNDKDQVPEPSVSEKDSAKKALIDDYEPIDDLEINDPNTLRDTPGQI